MKKIVSILLCVVLAVGCCLCVSCGDSEKKGPSYNGKDDGWTDNY